MKKLQNATVRIENLLKECGTQEFFEQHFISFNRAVSTYGALKYVYYKDTDSYIGFREAFFQFYGINRFVSDQFKNDFYVKLIELKGCKEFDLEQLIQSLKDKEKNKLQFSFITKMLNIIDDERYPIYDSNVAKAFGLHYVAKDSDSERIKLYLNHYEIITKVYKALLSKQQAVIKEFRNTFRLADSLSDMRILDIIVWKIGEVIKES